MCSLFSYVLIEIENKKLMRLKRLRSERTGRLTHLSALLRQKPVIFFCRAIQMTFFYMKRNTWLKLVTRNSK